MKNIFVYGSLMYDQVWSRVLKGRHTKIPARLENYKRLSLTGEIYPGVKASKGARVDGVLIIGLSDKALTVLDRFEGKYYRRQSVMVVGRDNRAYRADVYIIRQRYQHKLSKQDWCCETFQKKHLSQFLRTYP